MKLGGHKHTSTAVRSQQYLSKQNAIFKTTTRNFEMRARNMHTRRAREPNPEYNHIMSDGPEATTLEGAGRARARARALSTNQNLKEHTETRLFYR